MNKEKDAKILLEFIATYCHHHHGEAPEKILFQHSGEKAELCPDCEDLAQYAIKRREKCPQDPKPACKDCSTPCYQPQYKEKIRQVMRYSGMYFIKQGRVDYLFKYFSQQRS